MSPTACTVTEGRELVLFISFGYLFSIKNCSQRKQFILATDFKNFSSPVKLNSFIESQSNLGLKESLEVAWSNRLLKAGPNSELDLLSKAHLDDQVQCFKLELQTAVKS